MSSSTRIKLTTKTAQRKSAKRSLVVDSDDEDGILVDPTMKKPRLEDSQLTEDEEYTEQPSRLSKGKGATNQPTKRKRKPVVRREAEDDETFAVEEEEYADAASDYAEEDEEFGDVPKKKPAKGVKPKAKSKSEPKEITVRDERKGAPALKPALKLDEIVAVGGPSSAVSTPPADRDGSPSATKKLKLPTIKKNKGPSQPGKPTAASKLAIDGNPLPAPSSVVRTPAANVGHADFDLRNKNVYNALFSSTGNSRSGHVREEERRRELNKMRDEARAKRAVEANNSFDLQEQMEKILRYEPKLRPFVLYPNILAAKWKEEYEHERGRGRGRDERRKEEGQI